ncbi:MAG TPA: DUF1365 domain-containing protein [Steroidobacteraceae bacterium]|nr:DUF1365 domain-containing protein [Steroidobacteraceae bacterium]
MHSALYTGRLSHRRRQPVPHAFDYAVCYAWLDLAELDAVFAGRWFWSTRRPALAWLRRADYLGDPAAPLDAAVRDRVEAETGRRPTGPVRMLTLLRTFGHCFNPVTFYYCYDPGGSRVETVIAEITNTPWGERHAYVLPAERGLRADGSLRFRFGKAFHVSPFLPMDQGYDWTFTEPGAALGIRMVNHDGDERVFDATMYLERREIDGRALAWALVRHPFAALNVLRRIYWQAFRLWLKRVPFHDHPATRTEEPAT